MVNVSVAKLEVIVKDLNNLDCCLFICSKQTIPYLTVQGTRVTGKLLLAMGFCDFVCAR